MNNEIKRMQLLAGLLTESQFSEMKSDDAGMKSTEAMSEAAVEIVVKDIPTLKQYFSALGTGRIPIGIDSREAVELYNYIKDYLVKGKKASISTVAKTTKASFDRSTKTIKP